MQKGQAVIFLLIVMLILAGGAYYLGRQTTPTKPSSTPVIISQTPQPTPTPSPSPDETANWKIYTSKYFGYSFKYPPNFWISSVTTVGTISDAPPPPTNTVATMSITDFGQKPSESLNALVNRYMADRIEHLIKKSKNITVNNRSAIYLETLVSNKRYDLIFAETGNSNVVIINIHEIDDSLQPTINKILSTFKFTQ